MRFKLEIDCNNDAFVNNRTDAEISRILGRVQARLLLGEQKGKCHDVNGNTVGHWEMTEADTDEESPNWRKVLNNLLAQLKQEGVETTHTKAARRILDRHPTQENIMLKLLAALDAVDDAIARNPDEMFHLIPEETRYMIDDAIAKARGQ